MREIVDSPGENLYVLSSRPDFLTNVLCPGDIPQISKYPKDNLHMPKHPSYVDRTLQNRKCVFKRLTKA